MSSKNAFQLFREEAPDAAKAFDQLIGTLSQTSLDDKVRQLIYIGIKASRGEAGAVAAHVPMAKRAGATREEIRDTIVMTLTVSGVTGITQCLGLALEAYDSAQLPG
jgi:alkylhydroperoxidase/carboxymuconolactone decarboxylase family protein YurZ